MAQFQYVVFETIFRMRWLYNHGYWAATCLVALCYAYMMVSSDLLLHILAQSIVSVFVDMY